MGLIEEFVSRYRKEFDFYEQSAKLVAQLIDTNLQSAGIRAIVTFRAKSPTRLESKVRQRSKSKNYKTLDEIYSDIIDLAGVRVALYFPGERDQVGKLIRDLFVVTDTPKEFPSGSAPSYSKRFSGYWATHYRVRLRESSLNEAQRRYADAVVEVQVASVLMHAWSEVENDLVYKPMQGQLSDDEYAILDELNGLVMTGEIALERLQKAVEARVKMGGRKFGNHYELAAYLLGKGSSILKGAVPDAALGRVDLLFDLLERLDLLTPEQIDPYLASLSSDVERRPFAEQIVDQLLAEDQARYELYEELRGSREIDSRSRLEQEGVLSPETQKAIGFFLSQWIKLERLMRDVFSQRTGESPIVLPTARTLERLEISNANVRSELDSIRRLRNNLVHGIEIPNAVDIRQAAVRLGKLLPELRRAKRKG
jgi:ppGpp synthetase/RelA/SpoT-type nucleotidyltranferase